MKLIERRRVFTPVLKVKKVADMPDSVQECTAQLAAEYLR